MNSSVERAAYRLHADIFPKMVKHAYIMLLLLPAASPFSCVKPLSRLATRPKIRTAVTTEPSSQDAARTALSLLDLNGDGEISDTEFRKYLTEFRYNEFAISNIFEELDIDNNSAISLEELRGGLALGEDLPPGFVRDIEEESNEWFDEIDVNGDGSVSAEELRTALLRTRGYTPLAVDAIFRNLDVDGNGMLSREELRTGYLNYSAIRQAVVAVVKTLVEQKRWTPSQRAQNEAR